MFDALTDRLTGVFDRLSGRGVLSDKDIDEAMREVRVALLEADVALPVVRDFIAKAKERATGEAVIRAVKPADQVVKITYDGLEQGHAHFAHRLVDILLGQHATTGEPVENPCQPICQCVEHAKLLKPKRSRPPCTIAWTGGLAALVRYGYRGRSGGGR